MNENSSPWIPGTPIQSPVGEMKSFDLQRMAAADIYRLLISTIVPRPIALISTLSRNGIGNLAPFSFFNGVSSNPPCLMVSIARKADGSQKDTLRNILETKEFVVNTASRWLLEPLVHSGASFPFGTDEMKVVGLSPKASTCVKPPRVAEAAVQMECTLSQTLELGDGSAGSTTLVLGKILTIHVSEHALKEGRIDAQKLDPVSRLGGISYAFLGETRELPIPTVPSAS